MRAGVIRNPRSHANLNGRSRPSAVDAVALVEPATPEALAGDLKRFAAEGVDLIVVDGGDGTVREVLTALPAAYGAALPALAVIPSGKTNILAFDLEIPGEWTTDLLLNAAGGGRLRERVRPALELSRTEGPTIRGFVFGAAGYVRGTALAGGVHRARVFHNAAVILAIGGAAMESIGGGDGGRLRDGSHLTLAVDGAEGRAGPRLVTMATTLERLPFRMRPFGSRAPGLKYLDVDAPPRGLAAALPLLLWSRADAWLAPRGYRRGHASSLRLTLDGPVVVDGEVYPGGDMVLSEGPAVRFLAP